MGCPTEVEIGDNLVFSVTTHDPDTGVLTDADSVPTYRIYEDETDPPILTGSMAKLDDDDTTGFYTESIACTSGNGFENGKSYTVYIVATVDSDQGGISYGFKAYDERKSNVQKWLDTAAATPSVAGVPEVDLTHVMGTILTEGGAGRLAAALIKFLDVATPNGTINSLPGADADGPGGIPISDAGGLDLDVQLANTHEITVARMGVLTDWINGGRLDLILDAAATAAKLLKYVQLLARSDAAIETDNATELTAINADGGSGGGDFSSQVDSEEALRALIAAIPTTAMRGTDNAAKASVLGALDDAAAGGDPTDVDTAMQYIKQFINILVGTVGIVAFPAEAAPGNGVSLSEVIRAIHVDTNAGIGLTALATGTAQAGANGSITLAAGEPATDELYQGARIVTTGGTGVGQSRIIAFYDGTTKVATIKPNWATNPAADTTYEIQGADSSIGTIEHDDQSSNDLKHFVDSGYDRGSTKINGVILVDTTTTNTDMVATSIHAQPLVPNDIDLADTVSVRIGFMITDSLLHLPSIDEITPGTIGIDRKAIGGTSWSNVVNDAACSESAGLIYYDEVFDSGSGYAEGDSIRIVFKDQKVVIGGIDYVFADATGRMFQTSIRQTMRGTDGSAPLKNTAFADLEFLMVDETDFTTPETGLTVTGQVSKDGGAFGGVAGSIAEIGSGIYAIDATAADMNADLLTFKFSSAGAADTFVTIKTAS